MPYYEYYCVDNGSVVEVRHTMDEEIRTWGQLCDRSGADPGDTPADAPVERLMSLPVPTPTASVRGGPEPCGPGCACAMRG